MATLIQFKDNAEGHHAKPHFCTLSVKDAVVAQMKTRGYEVEAERGVSANMELGWGMARQDEPVVCFGVELGPTGGVRPKQHGWMGFPCYEIETFIHRLEKAEVREFNGVSYIKIHGYLCCMCITPAERADLLKRMKKSVSRCQKRVKACDARWDAKHPVKDGGAPTALILPPEVQKLADMKLSVPLEPSKEK